MRHAALLHIDSKQLRKETADFRTGDTVRVHWKVKEGEKERVQAFEGVVIRKTRGESRATFTVRKVSYGVGVERIFPLHSPRYERIEVLNHGQVNRNRLFYLRNLKGKAARLNTADEMELAAQNAAVTAAANAAAKAEAAANPPPPREAKKKEAKKKA